MKNVIDSADPRWLAIVSRDKHADGRFIYAVKTTGVYCSPSCSSRQPNRQNVELFDDAEQAEAAGYRPCKRCRQADAVDGAACAADSRGLPLYRTGGESAVVADAGAPRRVEPIPFPPAVQSDHRPDAERLCRRAAQPTAAHRSDAAGDGDRRDLRRRLWCQRPLPASQRRAGHDAEGLPGGWQRHAHPFRRRALFAGRDLAAQSEVGICAILLGTMRSGWCRICRTSSLMPS